MSKNTKTIFGIIGGILVLCVCLCVGGWVALKISGNMLEKAMIKDTPEEAATIAKEIIDYKLPSGYQEESAINMGFMQMITIADITPADRENARPIIMLTSMSSDIEVNEEEIRLRIQLSMKESSGKQGYDMELVDEQVITIRSQEIPLLVYEGTDENGVQMRQIVSGLFEGKNSKVMLFIAGKIANWNQEEIDSFLESIK